MKKNKNTKAKQEKEVNKSSNEEPIMPKKFLCNKRKKLICNHIIAYNNEKITRLIQFNETQKKRNDEDYNIKFHLLQDEKKRIENEFDSKIQSLKDEKKRIDNEFDIKIQSLKDEKKKWKMSLIAG